MALLQSSSHPSVWRSSSQTISGIYNNAAKNSPIDLSPNFQDLPAQFIKDKQAGDFFYLSKFVPKNLSLYDDEDNLVLSLDNSVVKVSRNAVGGYILL